MKFTVIASAVVSYEVEVEAGTLSEALEISRDAVQSVGMDIARAASTVVPDKTLVDYDMATIGVYAQ